MAAHLQMAEVPSSVKQKTLFVSLPFYLICMERAVPASAADGNDEFSLRPLCEQHLRAGKAA